MNHRQHIQDSIESDAARMGFVRYREPPDYRTIAWKIKCSRCPAEFKAHWNPGSKPELMQKNMRTRHWDVAIGMRPLCPTCAMAPSKGPLAKPEHQNFKPYVPPRTAIFDGLLNAAEGRAYKERINHLIEVQLDCSQAVVDAQKEKAEVKADLRASKWARMDEEKRERMRQRVSEGQRARWARQKAREQAIKEAREAGSDALAAAKLKEHLRDISTVPSPQEPQQAPQAKEEETIMKNGLAPSPKITHAVFQLLDSVFDPLKRLYKSGYTDQRVARDTGTTEEVVAYLRSETFGALAEDPRISSMRDDLELLRMEAAETFAKLQKGIGELQSRLEQVARAH